MNQFSGYMVDSDAQLQIEIRIYHHHLVQAPVQNWNLLFPLRKRLLQNRGNSRIVPGILRDSDPTSYFLQQHAGSAEERDTGEQNVHIGLGLVKKEASEPKAWQPSARNLRRQAIAKQKGKGKGKDQGKGKGKGKGRGTPKGSVWI